MRNLALDERQANCGGHKYMRQIRGSRNLLDICKRLSHKWGANCVNVSCGVDWTKLRFV